MEIQSNPKTRLQKQITHLCCLLMSCQTRRSVSQFMCLEMENFVVLLNRKIIKNNIRNIQKQNKTKKEDNLINKTCKSRLHTMIWRNSSTLHQNNISNLRKTSKSRNKKSTSLFFNDYN